jgi:hypothetical protein
MGGCASLVEGERCDALVIGYDIDLVAPFITRFELENIEKADGGFVPSRDIPADG